jgi:quercetin dioxygenase-like cupin family protein
MTSNYTYIADLVKLQEVPMNGTLSRTLYNDEHIKAVLFAFDAGQELSEHAASMPAILQVVQGEVRLELGTDSMEAGAGAWAYMPPHLPHSLYAKTPVVMFLLLIKTAKSGG